MDLVQSKFVTDDVERLAAFYARLVRVSVVLNDYYVMLDFRAGDVDAEYKRISRLGVTWVMPPATQLRGCRTMIFRDPAGNLVNVSAPAEAAPG